MPNTDRDGPPDPVQPESQVEQLSLSKLSLQPNVDGEDTSLDRDDKQHSGLRPEDSPELGAGRDGYCSNDPARMEKQPEGKNNVAEAIQLPKLPFGPAVELPEDIEKYTTETWVASVIGTSVPPAPIDPSERDPDGHSVWITSAATKAKYYSKGWPLPVPKIPNKIAVREAKDGMGLGVFATEDIKRFEPVLVERPYLVTTRNVLNHFVSEKAHKELPHEQLLQLVVRNQDRFLRLVFDSQMSEDARKGFMSLTNSHQQDGSGPIFGIIRTNGFGIRFEDAIPGADQDFGGYDAVGNIASRFNHSCIPDVSCAFNPSTFTLRFTAARDIPKGSEIHIDYTSPLQTKATRQAALAPYGVECTCPACVNATPESDKLREECKNLCREWGSQATNVWSKGPKLTDDRVLMQILETRKRMEAEGLDFEGSGYFLIHGITSAVYANLGNKEKAEEEGKAWRAYSEASKRVRQWMVGPTSPVLIFQWRALH